jgi:hypothetical protein
MLLNDMEFWVPASCPSFYVVVRLSDVVVLLLGCRRLKSMKTTLKEFDDVEPVPPVEEESCDYHSPLIKEAKIVKCLT